MRKTANFKLLLIPFVFIFFGFWFWGREEQAKEIPWDVDTSEKFSLPMLRKKLQDGSKEWPQQVHFDNHEYEIDYTFNSQLTNFILDLLKQYRPDFTSVVVMDNDTGKVLSVVDYGRQEGDMGMSLTFGGHHPSASLFKIITSAALLENGTLKKDSTFRYLGRSTTLYKHQLRKRNLNLWMREETFMEAFARSNNVIFGKAALLDRNKDHLLSMAKNFGFQEDLMEEFTLPLSNIYNPDDAFGLAELATGFNKVTTMTPIHGALLAQIIANKGTLKYPKIIQQIRSKGDNGGPVWRPSKEERVVLRPEVAMDLQQMMELTVQKGTAKRVFRELNKKLKGTLHIGGKTGSITGGEPFGKRDWFTVYAFPTNSGNGNKSKSAGISVCVMIVNVKKWYVKSTFLARKIIEYYFNSVSPDLEKI